MSSSKKMLSLFIHQEKKEEELRIAYQLADMGTLWQAAEEFTDDVYYAWTRLAGKNQQDSIVLLPSILRLQTDVLEAISETDKDNEYHPMGGSFKQARTNFLYLVTAQLNVDNPMKGKTVLQVKSATKNHSYNIITTLTPEKIKTMSHGSGEELLILFAKIKKEDPSAYIIDSLVRGYFRQPQQFIHYTPFIGGNVKHGIASPFKQSEVMIDAMGIVGDPNGRLYYYDYDGSKAKYVEESIDLEQLKHAAWIKYRENVAARVIPKGIFNKMQKDYAVITYHQISNPNVSFLDKHANKSLCGVTGSGSGATVAAGICIVLNFFSISTFGFTFLINLIIFGGIGFIVGMAIGIGLGAQEDSNRIERLNVDYYNKVNFFQLDGSVLGNPEEVVEKRVESLSEDRVCISTI